MRHHVHQLVATCVCLMFGAEQYCNVGFCSFFQWKRPSAAAEDNVIWAVTVSKNSKGNSKPDS